MVADHLRATTFLIADGVLPGNEGRGYVLRKIMRRALRHGKKLGIEGAFLGELTHAVVERMKAAYPELVAHAATVAARRVASRRSASAPRCARRSASSTRSRPACPAGGTIPGADVFRLYDTYGLPLDFTEELAARSRPARRRRGLREASSRPSRSARAQSSKLGTVKGDPVYAGLLEQGGRTTSSATRRFEVEDARVLAVLRDGALARRIDAGQDGLIVLDRTPFYANSGGQVGDRGVIASDGSAAEVSDTTSPLPGLHVHHVRVTHGGFEPGMLVRAEVDALRRTGAMRHHTGDAPAQRRAARDAGPARQAGGQPGGARPAALRLQPLRRRHAR